MSFNRRPLIATVAIAAAIARADPYTATYTPQDLPPTTEQGQAGTNVCGTTDSQDSMCQTAYFRSLDDFCLWAPPTPDGVIGVTERVEVAWCNAAGHGARLIPSGAITGAHWRVTPEYAEITGTGDLTALNIRHGDAGGELDPHGADGDGNPIGGVVFSDVFTPGKVQQIHEWMNFMSATQFCFRICNPASENAWLYCQHIYDEMGCNWVMPGPYNDGFDACPMDAGAPPGIVNWGQPDASTFQQHSGHTPPASPAPSSSSCSTFPSLAYGQPAGSVGNGTNSSTTAQVSTTAAPTTPTNTAATTSNTANTKTQQNNHSGAGSLAVPVAAFLGLLSLGLAL